MIQKRSYTRVTLALDILQKCTDGMYAGYHELGIVKHQIKLYDTITINESQKTTIHCNDPLVPQDSKNICWEVIQQFKKMFAIKEFVSIKIDKTIPVQGGLAGGSTNAATVMTMLNNLWNLYLTRQELCSIGRNIGMDVPFYFYGNTAFDSEATGILEPIQTSINLDLLLVQPTFGVSTRKAYENISYIATGKRIEDTNKMKQAFSDNHIDLVIQTMHNDFEYSVFTAYPALAAIKKDLLEKGCRKVVLSGSGSTLVGITKDSDHSTWLQQNISERCIVTSTHTS